MRSITTRIVTALLILSSSLAVAWLLSSADFNSSNVSGQSSQARTADNAKRINEAAEISLERIYDWCEGCPDRKIILRRENTSKFEDDAIIVDTDLHTKKERRGRLHAYFFNNLLKLIEAQGYFNLDNQYAMGFEDATIVTINVSIG